MHLARIGEYTSMLLGRQIGPVILTQILDASPVGILCKGYEVDLGPGFPCLVRVLPPQLWGQHEAIQSFLTLMRWHRKVLNPSITRCLYCDSDQEQGSAWAVLEWMESEALHEVQRSFKGQGNVRRILDIVRQMTSCVELLHRAGRVHGRLRLAAFHRISQASSADLDWIQLQDLGVGLHLSNERKARPLHSTAEGIYPDRGLDYLPPMSKALAGLTQQSDVYALVVSLYCLLTGQPPKTFQTGVHTLVQLHPILAQHSDLIAFLRRVAGNPLREAPSNAMVLQHTFSEFQESIKSMLSTPGFRGGNGSTSKAPFFNSSRKIAARTGRNNAQTTPPPVPSMPGHHNPNDSFIPFLDSMPAPSLAPPAKPSRPPVSGRSVTHRKRPMHSVTSTASLARSARRSSVPALAKSSALSNSSAPSGPSSSSSSRSRSSSTFASRMKPTQDALEDTVSLVSSGLRTLVRRHIAPSQANATPQHTERTLDTLSALAVVASSPSSSGNPHPFTPTPDPNTSSLP